MGKVKVVSKLGEGSYGSVYLVLDEKSQKKQVMKRIRIHGMTDEELQECRNEIEILQMMSNPYIIRYHHSFVAKGSLCIVMDYAERGDLYEQVKLQMKKGEYFDEHLVLYWITQACMGLQHIHDHKILHRDIKTKNIFLTSDGSIKIGDFGISRVLNSHSQNANSIVGAPYYMSPEMIRGNSYNHKTDVWSMGVVLYELISLQHPFMGRSIEDLARRILEGTFPRIPSEFSEDLSVLVEHMLDIDASSRFSMAQVLEYPLIRAFVEQLRGEQSKSSES